MFNTEIGIEDEKRDRWSAADLEGYLFRQRYPQDILLSEQYPSLLELPDLWHRRFQFMRELTRKHRREYLDVLVRPKTGNQMVFLTEGPIKGGKDGVVLSEEQDNRLIQEFQFHPLCFFHTHPREILFNECNYFSEDDLMSQLAESSPRLIEGLLSPKYNWLSFLTADSVLLKRSRSWAAVHPVELPHLSLMSRLWLQFLPEDHQKAIARAHHLVLYRGLPNQSLKKVDLGRY